MRYIAEISDPIHHYVYLTEVERDVIDTPVFQRLRRIRQLAGAHLTYPSAHHTRFEHSLGTMHLAGIAAETLYSKGLIDDDLIELLRLAALLHDIGHGPFSHLFEEVIEMEEISHEEIGSNIIRIKLDEILNKHGYSAREIAELSIGNSNKKFLNDIISGILSVDAMDYLQRDSYFTGAEHARIDAERIIKSYDVYDGDLAIDKSALYSLESLMISRYQMFKAVYFHKSVRAAEVMLLHAMIEAKELNIRSKVRNIDEYLSLTDDSMLNMLLNSNKRSSSLAMDYLDRRLLKCVFEHIIQSRDKLSYESSSLKEEIAREADLSEDDIYLDISKAPSLSLTSSKDKPSSLILVKKGPERTYEIIGLEDLPLINSILGYMNMIRVYTPVKYRDIVEEASNKVFNAIFI
ncbi:MAG: HD domain-containing protein [Candidatus Nitrosocaldaceae archaeon]